LNSISSEVFDHNRRLFADRFPELAGLLALDDQERALAFLESVPAAYAISASREGSPTLSVGGAFLHSRYDPARDAVRAVADSGIFTAKGCVFAGLGLAYVPELYAARFPDAYIILVEPDVYVFYLCLASRPLDALFSHARLFVMAGTQAREVTGFLGEMSFDELPVYENAALGVPAKAWFEEFALLRKRNREKREINANTLRKFGFLWMRNMCANLAELRDRDGIGRFANAFADEPALVLAAGPSLDRILPLLPRLRERMAIIAVDTAVRACVRAGVEPDFIVLVDPQYWNWRHLDGVSCPSSILITESAAWPAVFRFQCRAIYLCSSLFPLGLFMESRIGEKGALGAGGSVATTAWDFARHIGSRDIYMAALDLGFPGKKTHFTGSIFEERTHTASDRLAPAETAGYNALYGAGPYPVPNYLGGAVLTDKRLSLYAWWFESRLAAYPAHKTATLTPEGVRIPGFSVADDETILALPDIRASIDERITRLVDDEKSGGYGEHSDDRADRYASARKELVDNLSDMAILAKRGLNLCRTLAVVGDTSSGKKLLKELDALDRRILNHPAKDIAAMLFGDARRDLEGADSAKPGVIGNSEDLYRGIALAAERSLALLAKFR
jgi:hypothetical protein